jgi:gamma-glutamylcyclotransferase (GGCT)/AIG2-like uncharacterized protein YtfP
MPETETGALFVYGTLLRGQPNHIALPDGAVFVDRCWIPGRLYSVGDMFPALTDGRDGEAVEGELYVVPSFDATDRLERYRPNDPTSLYVRRRALAWGHYPVQAYYYNRPVEGLRRIASGNWIADAAVRAGGH